MRRHLDQVETGVSARNILPVTLSAFIRCVPVGTCTVRSVPNEIDMASFTFRVLQWSTVVG